MQSCFEKQQMVSNMAKLGGCTENGSIQSVNGGCHNKETKSRQSSTPPVRNMFIPPVPKTKVSNFLKVV